MTIKLGIVMDPIESLNYKKDTSIAMLRAARKRGFDLFYMTQGGLYQQNGVAMGCMGELSVCSDSDQWYRLAGFKDQPLQTLDVILMRKDPPFDNEFIYSTYFLEQAEQAGVLVVNKPQSLRDYNEKYFATLFPECTVPCIVSRDMGRLKKFSEEEGDVIFKPMDGMGGTSIFRVKRHDSNISVILETLTQYGNVTVMGQRFIPDITRGDKRVLLIDGEPVPYALARMPAKGELRGNLAAGGHGVGQPLSERDLWIAAQVAPVLKERGIMFAGLDIIGDYLTEINISSPTCVRELEEQYHLDIAGQLIDKIKERLDAR